MGASKRNANSSSKSTVGDREGAPTRAAAASTLLTAARTATMTTEMPSADEFTVVGVAVAASVHTCNNAAGAGAGAGAACTHV